jgi:hypothetical protein
VLLPTSRIDKAACSETTGTSSHPDGTRGRRADGAARGGRRLRPTVAQWRGARGADLPAMPGGTRSVGGATDLVASARAGSAAGAGGTGAGGTGAGGTGAGGTGAGGTGAGGTGAAKDSSRSSARWA